MALPVTITGISTAVAPVGPFKADGAVLSQLITNATLGIGVDSGTLYRAQVFQATGNWTLTSVCLQLGRTGSPTDNVLCQIWDTSGGVPTTLLASATNTVAASGVPLSAIDYFFSFSSVPLVNGTSYAIVVTRSGAFDLSNRVNVSASSSSSYAGGLTYTSSDGVSWSAAASTSDFKFVILSSTVSGYYFFGRDGTTATTLQAFKSTAPDTSWASVTTKTGFTTAILGLSAYQVGPVVHIAVMDGTASTAVGHKYTSFDMVSDTFLATTETVAAAAATTGQVGGANAGNSIVVRANGEVVFHYSGVQTKTSGTFRSRTYYRRRTGLNTYGTETQVDANAARDAVNPMAQMGASDLIHFFYQDANNIQRHFTAANVLGTAGTAISGTALLQDVVTYDDAGTQRLVGNNAATFFRFNSGNNPTISTTAAATGLPARGVDDNGNPYFIYQNSSDSDLYIKTSADDGASWGSATSVFTGTVASAAANLSKNQFVYQRGANVVFPYIVNDSGTLKYNEHILRTLTVGYTLPITVGAVALAGIAAGLRADRRMAAVTGAVALTGPATGVRKGYVLAASTGAVAVTRYDANLLPHRVYALPITKGSVVVDFLEANLGALASYSLPASTGAVTGSMKDAALRRVGIMPAATGAIALSGHAATLRYGHKTLAVAGAITLAGQVAGVRRGTRTAAAPGAVVLAGTATAFTYSRKIRMTASPGAVALAGNSAALILSTADDILPAALGAITASMKAATLRAARVLVALPSSRAGDFIDDDGIASFIDDLGVTSWVDDDGLILGGTGSVAVAGQAAALLLDTADAVMPAATGTVTLAGQAAALRYGHALLAVKGAIAVTFNDAAFRLRRVYAMIAAPGGIVVSGQVAALNAGGNKAMIASPGAIVLSGQAAALRPVRRLPVASGPILLTGHDVDFDLYIPNHVVAAPPRAIVLAAAEAGLHYTRHEGGEMPPIAPPGPMRFGQRAYIPNRW